MGGTGTEHVLLRRVHPGGLTRAEAAPPRPHNGTCAPKGGSNLHTGHRAVLRDTSVTSQARMMTSDGVDEVATRRCGRPGSPNRLMDPLRDC